MGHEIDIPRPKDETSSKLEWIFAKFVLAMSAGLRPLSGKRVVFAQ